MLHRLTLLFLFTQTTKISGSRLTWVLDSLNTKERDVSSGVADPGFLSAGTLAVVDLVLEESSCGSVIVLGTWLSISWLPDPCVRGQPAGDDPVQARAVGTPCLCTFSVKEKPHSILAIHVTRGHDWMLATRLNVQGSFLVSQEQHTTVFPNTCLLACGMLLLDL